jgi:hypothetical protein
MEQLEVLGEIGLVQPRPFGQGTNRQFTFT